MINNKRLTGQLVFLAIWWWISNGIKLWSELGWFAKEMILWLILRNTKFSVEIFQGVTQRSLSPLGQTQITLDESLWWWLLINTKNNDSQMRVYCVNYFWISNWIRRWTELDKIVNITCIWCTKKIRWGFLEYW